jgi:5-methylcytosine-specific restriction endonuclease McrA
MGHSAEFDASQRAAQARHGVLEERQGRGVAAQVALARRESPHRGQQHLGLAKILVAELPHTMAAFRVGRITEWKATIVARETACLSLEDRRVVDTELAGNPERIEAIGDGALAAAAREIAYRLDPASYVERRRRAEADRRVTLRPAPDVMSQLSALLPVKSGVAVYAALTGEADRLKAAGDPRSRGQIMADALVDRILGTTSASPTVVLNVVVSDDVLWGKPGAAHVDGYGPVPGDLVRELAGTSRTWVRRLYARPETGSLVAMDSHSRLLPNGLAQMIRLRDQQCRTPWCDAPIRHGDHVTAAADDGPTSEGNAQGLCEACNHAKQAPGWHARSSPGHRHQVETTTPTGHHYMSVAPPATTPIFVETHPGVWTVAA